MKEMTIEEIEKALDFCYSSPCCGSDCPYFNKHGRNFCVEDKALYKDMKRIVLKHAEQKAEIERLTEENAILKGNPPLLAGRSLGKTIREKLLAFDKMKEQSAELQKQVDELKLDLENWKKAAYGYKYAEEQAVKDTAPVAINRFINQLHIDGVLRDEGDLSNELRKVKVFVLKRYYGVEVE